jgi:hypothetical protein
VNGNIMYEIARQRSAERQQAAQRAAAVREARRGRHATSQTPEPAGPAIPDFAHEMFGAEPEPGAENAPGRHARANG